MNQHLFAGILDARELTPWEHCPMTFEEWRNGAVDTQESAEYWKGFNGGIDESFAKAQREAARKRRKV